jgi:pimeloyl-ACP methyl ester carboxylesterase
MNDTAPDPRRHPLLASLSGARPSAPDWFGRALADAPERGFTEAAGAGIETLTWGERGKPGLLFLHGNGAHADWWSFIAPFFSSDYRCAALSWSGMGGSDRRERYSFDIFVQEAMTVAEATGLFESKIKPVFVGHSFGGFPAIGAAARHGGAWAARSSSTRLSSRPNGGASARTRGPPGRCGRTRSIRRWKPPCSASGSCPLSRARTSSLPTSSPEPR